MRRLSLAHMTVMDADPLQLLEAAAAGGFDAVGLRVVPPLPGDRIIEVIGDLPLRRQIKERLEATGLTILDIEAIWLTPQTDVASLMSTLDVGAELGAEYLLTVGHDPDRSRLVANFSLLCEAANRAGLRTDA